jgi:hypothetical protein
MNNIRKYSNNKMKNTTSSQSNGINENNSYGSKKIFIGGLAVETNQGK